MHKGIWWDKPESKGQCTLLVLKRKYKWDWVESLENALKEYRYPYPSNQDLGVLEEGKRHGWFKECKLILPEEFLVVGGKH